MQPIVTDPPVQPADKERAQRIRSIYEARIAVLGIPPYESPLESAMAAAGAAAVLEASRP